MTVTISEDDGRYTVEIVTSVGTVTNKFRLNEPFSEMTADGLTADVFPYLLNTYSDFEILVSPFENKLGLFS